MTCLAYPLSSTDPLPLYTQWAQQLVCLPAGTAADHAECLALCLAHLVAPPITWTRPQCELFVGHVRSVLVLARLGEATLIHCIEARLMLAPWAALLPSN